MQSQQAPSSSNYTAVIKSRDLISFLCLSMLEDDLKLSSSEDSDGEQDSAKNASRNTSAR